jgi:BolA-like protein 3
MLAVTRRMFSTGLQARRFSTSVLISNTNVSSPPDATEGERNIYAKLTEKFSPSQLQVQDISGSLQTRFSCRGYLYFIPGGCGSFYAITISSQAFKGLPIVRQHKLVTQTLKEEIEGIHGLQVQIITLFIWN